VTARIYIDEDSMDRALVAALEARAVDVLTALAAGMIERDDVDHLLYSTQERRILLTCNVGDFCRLHSEFLDAQRTHAGVICMKQQSASIGDTQRRLLRLLSELTPDEMTNRLEFLANWPAA
jgi:hypothetical protein